MRECDGLTKSAAYGMGRWEVSMGIVQSDQVEAFEYGEGIWVKKLAVPETGTESISVGTATFEPGAFLPCHIHH